MSAYSADALAIDAAAEAARIASAMKSQLVTLRKRGVTLGLSGGVDSSVCLALAVAAVGRERVFGLLMPEAESDPESLELGRLVADTFGVETKIEDIGPTLVALDCYARRDAAIRGIAPDYGPGWRFKLAIADTLGETGYAISTLVVENPDGLQTRFRLTPEAYRGIVAATNMKQRTRKQIEYYHADRLNYAVLGTPNRLEYDQGFFVKNGDGAADMKPIAHLYKSQVYALAAHLGVPETIRLRPPTTDTFPLAQTQEEFYFSLPYARLDICLHALNHGVCVAEAAAAAELTEDETRRVFADIFAKRRATRHLHSPPLLVEPVEEIG